MKAVNILNIRQEQPADYDMVYRIIKEAFANAEHSDGNEQEFNKIVGHIKTGESDCH